MQDCERTDRQTRRLRDDEIDRAHASLGASTSHRSRCALRALCIIVVAAMMGLTSQELSNCLAPGDTRPARARQRHLSIQRLAVMSADPEGKKVFAFFCYLLAKKLNADEVLESAAMVGRTLDHLQLTMAKAELRDKERKVS